MSAFALLLIIALYVAIFIKMYLWNMAASVRTYRELDSASWLFFSFIFPPVCWWRTLVEMLDKRSNWTKKHKGDIAFVLIIILFQFPTVVLCMLRLEGLIGSDVSFWAIEIIYWFSVPFFRLIHQFWLYRMHRQNG